MGGKVKNENIKVEKKDKTFYYLANQDLKKLDFIDNKVCFIGSVRNCPSIFSIKYNNGGYANTIYTVSNDCNNEIIKISSLSKIKEFIANNIVN